MAAARRREPDPATALEQFARGLEDGPLARGYLIRGDERWFRSRCVEQIKARAEERGDEVCLHDAERGNADFSRSRLTDDLSGGGLFASRRLVVVRHPENELKKGDGGGPSPVTRAMLGFLTAPDDVGTLVLDASSVRADHAVAKAIKGAGGSVLSFRKLYDSPPPWKPDPRETELVQWFLKRARSKGVRLNPSQAVYVCAATGNDLAALDDQLERLRAGGGRLEEIVGWTAAIEPWTVADRIVDGPPAKALAAIEMLFQGGHQDKSGRRTVDATALVAMLVAAVVRGVRQGNALARALASTRSEEDAIAEVGIPARGPARDAALARARTRPPEAWARLLSEALELERRAKGGGSVGVDDFCATVLRWERTAPRAAAGGAGRGRSGGRPRAARR